jgi:hypothetical protein
MRRAWCLCLRRPSVAQNGPATPPMESVAQVSAPADADEVSCTRTEAPLPRVPAAVVNAAPPML